MYGDVAVVELEVLDEVDVDAEDGGVLDGDDTAVADRVERAGDRIADRLVVVGRDRRDAAKSSSVRSGWVTPPRCSTSRATATSIPRLMRTGLPPLPIAVMP